MSLDKALLRMEEVAEVLAISRARAYQMAATGAIPSITIGRSRRVLVRQLNAWIEEHVVEARRIELDPTTTGPLTTDRPTAADGIKQTPDLP
jgi:excisionase family DNA binding protein